MLSGSVVRMIVTFNDWTSTGSNSVLPIDPDTNAINIYDSKLNLLLGDVLTKDTVGLYHYDYTLPSAAGTYTVEIIGTIAGYPNVYRTNISTTYS